MQMAQITAAELHNLHELIWMEATLLEKFLHYRHTADEEHVRELCDRYRPRRQHLTALAQLLGPTEAGALVAAGRRHQTSGGAGTGGEQLRRTGRTAFAQADGAGE